MSSSATDTQNGRSLLTLLIREEHLTASSGAMLERYMARWELSAYHAILMTRLMSEAELASALASLLGMDRLYNLTHFALAEDALSILPFSRARAWECLPLVGEGSRVELVVADPTRSDRISEIKQGLKREMTLSVAERSDIVRAIDELYPLQQQLPSFFGLGDPYSEEPT